MRIATTPITIFVFLLIRLPWIQNETPNGER